MSELKAWAKIIGRLDEAQRRLLRRFVLSSIRRRPAVLWLDGPAASGRSALVQSISAAAGTVIVINGYDLDRGGFALSPLYEYASGKTIASLLIIKAGRISQRFSNLLFELDALASRDTVSVRAKNRESLKWACDLPILFVADDPPPEGSGLALRVELLELAAVEKKQTLTRDFTTALGRTVRRWALSAHLG